MWYNRFVTANKNKTQNIPLQYPNCGNCPMNTKKQEAEEDQFQRIYWKHWSKEITGI